MEGAQPQFRIYTFGKFSFDTRLPDGTWQSVYPLTQGPVTHENHTKSVLGYLLCCPFRRAFRVAIIRELWGSNSVSGDEYMQRVTSRLRKLLGLEPYFLLTADKKRYELADQSLIWVDADHCIALMEKAKQVGLATVQRLALLEEAETYFRRGIFLEEESGTWVHSRRGKLLSLYYDCRISLAKGYLAQGQFPQAERIIETILHENPFDENALIHLMIAQHMRGMKSEALRRYRDTVALAKQTETVLSAEIQDFAQHFQTGTTQWLLETFPYLHDGSAAKRASSSDSQIGGTIPKETDLGKGEIDTDPLRRKFGGLLRQTAQAGVVGALAPTFGSPDILERLVQAVKRPSFIDRALLNELRSSVTDCWKLHPNVAGIVSSKYLTTVHTHLAYLVELLEVPLYPSIRQELTSLAAECSLIHGILSRDIHLPGEAERYFTMAYTAADEADNQALKATIRGWMSKLPIEYSLALAFLEEALPLAKKYGTDTTYSWLQARNAEHLSIDGQYATESEKALEQATTFSPKGDPEHDPYWTCFDEAQMYGYQGSCYIELQQPEAAKTAFLRELQLSDPRNPNRQSLIQIDLARVCQLQGDIVNACLCGHRALSLISRARSLDHLQQLESFRSNFPSGQTDVSLQAFDEHKGSVEELLREHTHFEEMR